jgi:hypothetical protein
MRWLLRQLISEAEARQIEADQAELHESWVVLHGAEAARRRLRRERSLLIPRLLVERAAGAITGTFAALPSAGKDARHALRGLTRTPGTALTIVLTLGLALGATTAMLAIVRGVLLEPLPYTESKSLVWIYTDSPPNKFRFSLADYQALEADHPAFTAVGASQNVTATVAGQDGPEEVRVTQVTASYFPLLGLTAGAGRLFNQHDDGDRDTLAVMTMAYWRSRSGADPAVIGRTVAINGLPHTIVGVLPADADPIASRCVAVCAGALAPATTEGTVLLERGWPLARGCLTSSCARDAARDQRPALSDLEGVLSGRARVPGASRT